MRQTSTLILLLLVTALGLYIWLRERHELTTTETREALQQVLRFDPDQAVALRWTYRDESVAVERRGDQWWLLDPLEDRANPDAVLRVLQLASSLTIIETMGTRELRGSDTGLGSRVIGLEIDLADGTTLDVEVGQAGPFTESTYLRFDPHSDGNEMVALADGNLRDPLRIPVDDWRDPTLLDFEPAEVIGLRLRTPGGEIVATRPPDQEDAMWQLERPLQTRGHRSRIDDLLALLGNLEIRAVASAANSGNHTGPLTDEELAIHLTLTDNRELTLALGAPESGPDGRIRARAGDRPHDFHLDDPILRLATLTPNDLRDDQLANIDPAVVQTISIESPTEATVELARRGENWWLVTGDLAQQANADRIRNLVLGLNRQPIVEFTSDTAADVSRYGLHEPLRVITLSTRPWSPEEQPNGTTGPTAQADTVRLRIGQAENYRLYAKYDGEPFVYQVTAEVLNVMPPQRVRWRSLQLMRFSLFHLESLRMQQGLLPPLDLYYQADSYQWRARYADRDVSALLDRQQVDLLAATLATFQVNDWLTERSDAYRALREPSLRIQLIIRGGIDPETGEPTTRERAELTFASSAPELPAAPYYGQINDHPDVFIIPATVYQRLAAPPFDPDRVREFQQGTPPGQTDDLPPLGSADDLPPLGAPNEAEPGTLGEPGTVESDAVEPTDPEDAPPTADSVPQ